MPKVKSVFLDFVRLVVNGEIDEVSRRLAASPSFATAPAEVGADTPGRTRRSFSPKSLTTFTPATRPCIWRPPRFGVRSQNSSLRTGRIAARRIAAAPNPFTTRRTPTAGSRRHRRRRSSTSCRLAQIPMRWIRAAWRPCTERCEHGRCPRSERCWMAAPTRGRQIRPGRRPCTSPFRPLGEEGAVLEHAREQQTGIIRLLLERGARPTDKDGRGKQVRQAATSEWIRTLLIGASG